MIRVQTVRRRYQTISECLDESIYFGSDEWEELDLINIPLYPDNGIVEGDINARAIKSDSGIEYYHILPAGTKRCKVYTQFYQLKPGAKTWKKENVLLKVGLYFLIYSPKPNVYYLRQVYDGFNPESVKQYIRDKNLYLIEQ